MIDIGPVTTPGGATAKYAGRAETSDWALIGGIVGEDEYGLGKLPRLSGWAIDVGAHIGIVSVALAVDNPELRIVAVEALPENVAVLTESIALNGLGERIFIEAAAAASEEESAAAALVPITYGWTQAENQPDGYMADNRFIGGMVGANETSQTIFCPALSLVAIIAKYEIDRVALLKIDCEGCEWFFLTSPAIAKVDLILGEMHIGKHGGAADLRRMLEPTHVVEMDDSLVVAHFTATRR